MIEHGIDVVTVANILGHSQVSTTDNIYAHIIEAERTKASECLADVILRRKQGEQPRTVRRGSCSKTWKTAETCLKQDGFGDFFGLMKLTLNNIM